MSADSMDDEPRLVWTANLHEIAVEPPPENGLTKKFIT
jgi:hypothetical protein